MFLYEEDNSNIKIPSRVQENIIKNQTTITNQNKNQMVAFPNNQINEIEEKDDGLILFDDDSEDGEGEEFKKDEPKPEPIQNKFLELQAKYNSKKLSNPNVEFNAPVEEKNFTKKKENYIEKQKNNFKPESTCQLSISYQNKLKYT